MCAEGACEPGEVAADVTGAENEDPRAGDGGDGPVVAPGVLAEIVAIGVEVLHEHEDHGEQMLGDGLAVCADRTDEVRARRQRARRHVLVETGGVQLEQAQVSRCSQPCGCEVADDDLGAGDLFVRDVGFGGVGDARPIWCGGLYDCALVIAEWKENEDVH